MRCRRAVRGADGRHGMRGEACAEKERASGGRGGALEKIPKNPKVMARPLGPSCRVPLFAVHPERARSPSGASPTPAASYSPTPGKERARDPSLDLGRTRHAELPPPLSPNGRVDARKVARPASCAARASSARRPTAATRPGAAVPRERTHEAAGPGPAVRLLLQAPRRGFPVPRGAQPSSAAPGRRARSRSSSASLRASPPRAAILRAVAARAALWRSRAAAWTARAPASRAALSRRRAALSASRASAARRPRRLGSRPWAPPPAAATRPAPPAEPRALRIDARARASALPRVERARPRLGRAAGRGTPRLAAAARRGRAAGVSFNVEARRRERRDPCPAGPRRRPSAPAPGRAPASRPRVPRRGGARGRPGVRAFSDPGRPAASGRAPRRRRRALAPLEHGEHELERRPRGRRVRGGGRRGGAASAVASAPGPGRVPTDSPTPPPRGTNDALDGVTRIHGSPPRARCSAPSPRAAGAPR